MPLAALAQSLTPGRLEDNRRTGKDSRRPRISFPLDYRVLLFAFYIYQDILRQEENRYAEKKTAYND